MEKDVGGKFEALAARYFPYEANQRARLKKKLAEIDEVIAKLDAPLVGTLRKSLKRYADLAKHSVHSVFHNFIVPLPIPGLRD